MIIPSYNSARYLAEAIQSVLDQSYADFEIIVVNDGSTDETEAVVKGFSDERIRYFAQENKGVGAARNVGLRLARGEYVAFLDADDLFLPEKLSRQVEFLLQDPSVDLVFSGWEYINAEGKILGVEEPWKYRSSVLGVEDVLMGGGAPVHAVLVRRRCLENVGGFDEAMRAYEDSDLWLRLAVDGCRMVLQSGVVCQYRLHDKNTSKEVSKHERWYLYCLKKFFDLELPKNLSDQKTHVFADCFLSLSARYYLHRDLDNAHRVLQEAIDWQPELLDEDNLRVADILSHPVCSSSYAWFALGANITSDEYIDIVCSDLEMRFPAGKAWAKRVRRNFYVYTFFFRGRKSFSETVRLWMAIFMLERGWVLNRGGWSILFRAFLRRWK